MDCVREPAIVTSDSDVTRQDLRGKFAEKLVGDWIPIFARSITPKVFTLKNGFAWIEINDFHLFLFHLFLPRTVSTSIVAALTS